VVRSCLQALTVQTGGAMGRPGEAWGRGPAHRLKDRPAQVNWGQPAWFSRSSQSHWAAVELTADSLTSRRDFKTQASHACALSGKFFHPRPQRPAPAVGQHHCPDGGDVQRPPSCLRLTSKRARKLGRAPTTAGDGVDAADYESLTPRALPFSRGCRCAQMPSFRVAGWRSRIAAAPSFPPIASPAIPVRNGGATGLTQAG
jgi:hypothetical protein